MCWTGAGSRAWRRFWSLMAPLNVVNRYAALGAGSPPLVGLTRCLCLQVAQLQKDLRPLLLRRVKEDVEKSIPAKEETIVHVELTTLQKKYYRAIFERNRNFLSRGGKRSVAQLSNVEVRVAVFCDRSAVSDHPRLPNADGASQMLQPPVPDQWLGRTRGTQVWAGL